MNTKTKMRMLSLLLCFVMLVGLMPTTALAAEKVIIDPISATVTLPTAGAHPVETGTPGDSSYDIMRVSFSKKDADSGMLTSLDPSDTFEAGATYRINVKFRAKSGFTIEKEAKATINGMEAEYWSTIADGYDSRYFGLEYTVPAEITSISVTVPKPVAGETADTNGITINPAALSVSSAEWCMNKDGVGLVSVNKFTAGKTYYLVIKYDVAQGYTVSESAAVLHNLTGGEIAHNSLNKTIMIEYTVPGGTPKTPIESVKLGDVTEPSVGATPDFDVTITGAEFDDGEYGAIFWYKIDPETYSWDDMDVSTPFGTGTYGLEVFLKAEAGFEFTEDTKFYFGDEELPEYDGRMEHNYELNGEDYAAIYLYFTLEEASDTYMLGDVNNDGKLNATDYLMLKKVIFNTLSVENLKDPDNAFARCDVSGDGKLSAVDYLRLKKQLFA